MAVYGYWSCFKDSEDQFRKVIDLEKAGCERIYGDKIVAGSSSLDRKELWKCIDQLEENDLLILEDLTKFGMSMVKVLAEVNNLIQRGVFIKTLDLRLDTSLMNEEIVKLIFGVMGYVADCELIGIKDRTNKGKISAKRDGIQLGAKRKFDKSKVAEIIDKRKQGKGYGTIAKELRMNRSTVQKILQREGVRV